MRQVVAVGNLVRVWLDPPTAAAGLEELTRRFEEHFGKSWQDVMCDAHLSFNYHRTWKGFYAVSELARIPGFSTSFLELYGTGIPVGLNYNRKPVLVEDIIESGVKK